MHRLMDMDMYLSLVRRGDRDGSRHDLAEDLDARPIEFTARPPLPALPATPAHLERQKALILRGTSVLIDSQDGPKTTVSDNVSAVQTVHNMHSRGTNSEEI